MRVQPVSAVARVIKYIRGNSETLKRKNKSLAPSEALSWVLTQLKVIELRYKEIQVAIRLVHGKETLLVTDMSAAYPDVLGIGIDRQHLAVITMKGELLHFNVNDRESVDTCPLQTENLADRISTLKAYVRISKREVRFQIAS